MIKLRPSLEISRQTNMDNERVIGAEIGVLGGTNAISILENYPQVSTLHLVDGYGGITDQDEKFIKWKTKFNPLADRITWHIKPSLDAAKTFGDHILDFAYIDANHDYKNVVADIDAWWPKVRADGILAGHDYFTFGGVKMAVDEFANQNKLWVFSTAPDWWIFKE